MAALDVVFTKMPLVLVLVGGGGSRTDSVSYSWFKFFIIQISNSFFKTVVVMWGFSSKEDPFI